MTEALTFTRTAKVVPLLVDLGAVDSTNLAVASLMDAKPYTTVVSANQFAGRGRNNREWSSRPSESLAVSTLVPTDSLRVDGASLIPLIAGLAVIRALASLGITGASLKWPNDVMLDGKKLSGILCRSLPSGMVAVGVGINLFFETQRPVPHATSVAEYVEFVSSTPDIWASSFLHELRSLMGGEQDALLEEVPSVMNTIGRKVAVTGLDGIQWSGLAIGLGMNGCLMVEDLEGRVREVVAADVEHLYQ